MTVALKVLALTFFIACSLTAHAIPITWRFEGHTAGPGAPGGTCEALGCQDILSGTYFSGRFTFDSDAPDLEDGDIVGHYISSGGPYGLHLRIGNYRYDTDIVRIVARADYPLSINPEYNIWADQVDTWFYRLRLWNCYPPESNIITSDDLKMDPPPLAGGTGGCMSWPAHITTTGGFDIAIALASWSRVPEPGTIALLGLGLVGLAIKRRHKH